MRNSIARVSLTIFIIVLIATGFIPLMEGSFAPIFGFLVFLSFTILVGDNKKFKIAGLCFLILSLTLFATDYRAGKEREAKFQELVKSVKSSQQ